MSSQQQETTRQRERRATGAARLVSLLLVLAASLLLPPFSPLVGIALAATLLRGDRGWQVAVIAISILVPAVGWLGLHASF